MRLLRLWLLPALWLVGVGAACQTSPGSVLDEMPGPRLASASEHERVVERFQVDSGSRAELLLRGRKTSQRWVAARVSGHALLGVGPSAQPGTAPQAQLEFDFAPESGTAAGELGTLRLSWDELSRASRGAAVETTQEAQTSHRNLRAQLTVHQHRSELPLELRVQATPEGYDLRADKAARFALTQHGLHMSAVLPSGEREVLQEAHLTFQLTLVAATP